MFPLPTSSEEMVGFMTGIDWGVETGLSKSTGFDRPFVGDTEPNSVGMRDEVEVVVYPLILA